MEETRITGFRLGDNYAQELTQAARDIMFDSMHPEKAINILRESIGCARQHALDVISGHMILFLSEDKTYIEGIDYNPITHKETHPLYPIESLVISRLKELLDCANMIYEVLHKIRFQARITPTVYFEMPYQHMVELITKGEKVNLEDTDRVDWIRSTLKISEGLIEEYNKFHNLIKWLVNNYPETIIGPGYACPHELIQMVKSMRFQVITGKDVDMQYSASVNTELVEKHLAALDKIEEAFDEGIKPVDITQGYKAGWLSPEGVYYALNGEISNMLHINIADMLLKQGVIPKGTDNPDKWLEYQGWVKIHDRHVLYAGWNLLDLGEPSNIAISEEQKSLLAKYARSCYEDNILELGFSREKVHASLIERTEVYMMRKYFVF